MWDGRGISLSLTVFIDFSDILIKILRSIVKRADRLQYVMNINELSVQSLRELMYHFHC